MQQLVTKLPLKISVRRSARKLELRPKEFDITDLDGWLETENQVQEWLLAMEVPKRILTKRKPSQIQRNRTGSRKQKKTKKKIRVMRLMQIQELKWNALCAKKSNVI